jgi:hypothetical protein
MSKTLTLEVPEQVYEAVCRAAAASGLGDVDWVAADLCRRLNLGGFGPVSPAMAESPRVGRGPRPQLTPAEWEAARQRLLRFAGVTNSGDPRSADNDRIDADLAREYAGGNEKAA